MRTDMLVERDHASGLELDQGDANAIADEQDLFGTAMKDVEAAVFVPFSRCAAELGVLQEFDGYVAEGLWREIAEDMREGCGDEADVAVREVGGDGRLGFDGVDDLGALQCDQD